MLNRYETLLANPSGVTVTPLAGDASGRRYERWTHPAFDSMIHMDARDDRANSVNDFVRIGEHLQNIGISSPQILARDVDELLLEDLGDNLYSNALLKDPSLETELYVNATEVLIQTQNANAPKAVPDLDPNRMCDAISPAFECYLLGATGNSQPRAHSHISVMLKQILERSMTAGSCLLLRDYHADNLLWLPNRQGVARTGVLDFQDAQIGHPCYDLASLLEDARRDVDEATRVAAINHFLATTQMNPQEFEFGFHAQAAQRNLRILGVLANLSLSRGKPSYLNYIPRVWSHLLRDLKHPSLAQLEEAILNTLPTPTIAVLKRLEGPDA